MKEKIKILLYKKENKKFQDLNENNYNQIQEKIEFIKKEVFEEENINQKRLYIKKNFYQDMNDSLEDKKITKKI